MGLHLQITTALFIIFVFILFSRVYPLNNSVVLNMLADITKFSVTGYSKQKVPYFDHIVLIVMENKSYEEIVNNKNAPYINSLIKQYSQAKNYYSIRHPSLPNYIALISGSTYGMTTNCTTCLISKKNLIDQMENSHKTWKAYFESLPSPCFLGKLYPYTPKFNSFINFKDIVANNIRCHDIVPYAELQNDIKYVSSTPDFIWISPNLCHDMHFCGIDKGDSWLAREIPIILNSESFREQNSLLILTWDEAERYGKNHVLTVFAGRLVKNNYTSSHPYNHYSLLRTIEKSWNLPPLTDIVKNSVPMSDLFK